MNIPRCAAGVAMAALVAACCLALPAAGAATGDSVEPAPAAMTAEQIVDRSVEMRGGLAAWSKIATIIWEGHLVSQRSSLPSLPFRLEEKRPGKSRFEISEPSQRSLRVFNGESGWKMKLGEDGRPEIKQFTAQEVKFARSAPGLEGPLIDFRAKGSAVELEGTEDLEGRKTYRIGVRLATGEHQTVWVDAESFLESRYDRTAYGPTGPKGTISVRYRDFKEVQGLALPSVIEISGAGGSKADRMLIERVALNPPLDDREFDGLGDPRGRAATEPKATPR
jgi:outer membrane lipoprotein-sorting protein